MFEKNMKPILVVSSFFLALSLFFLALSSSSEDDIEAFGKQMMTFYQSASQEAFQRLQRNADIYEKNLSNNGADVPLAVAIARIAEKHNWPIEAKGAAGLRAKEILARSSDFAKYIEDDEMIDPSKLDIWWASFFATGDTVYLEKIFQYAGEPLPTADMQKMLVIGAATWSFGSNCGQDEAVKGFAKLKLASVTNPEKKAFLQECIKSINE